MSRPPAPSARRPAAPTGRPTGAPARPARRVDPRAPSGAARVRAGLGGLGERVGAAVGDYRTTLTSDGSPHWVSGLLAGAQGAVLSFLVVVLPAMTAYVATSADPTNAQVGWPRAASVGSAIWLLGHGGALRASDATITLIPLGLTALAVFGAYASARRTARPTPSAWLASIGGYLAVALLALLVAGQSGPLGAGPLAVLRLVLGAVLVAALGGGAAVLTPRDVGRALSGRDRVPRWTRLAVRAGVACTAALVVLASAVTVLWLVLGRAATDDVVSALALDPVGGVVLGVAQLAVLPNLVLWALAWLVGPGFAVGLGTAFAPDVVVGGPMPALPLLGALPAGAGGGLRAAPLAVVLLGAVAGWWWHRRRESSGAWQPFVAALTLALTGGAAAGALSALAGGSAGPGRLAVVGAPVLEVAATAALLLLVGALLVAVPAEPAVRAGVARGARATWRRVRGGAQPPVAGVSSDVQDETRDASSA